MPMQPRKDLWVELEWVEEGRGWVFQVTKRG